MNQLILTSDENKGQLPVPLYPISSVYGTEDVRLRMGSLPDDLEVEFLAMMSRLAWTVSAKTANDYQGIIRNYWHFCAVNGLERYRLTTVRDYLYLVAYPRMLYLQGIASGLPTEARGTQPGLGRASIKVAIAAIGKSFAVVGRPSPIDDPEWRSWLRGLLRRLRQDKDRKDPIIREDLRRAVALAREHKNQLVGLRDAALLLLGFSCALRRSEIVAVTMNHLRKNDAGFHLWVPKSKTDQDGRGMVKPIYIANDTTMDPLMACREWTNAAAITTGPIFRSIDRFGNISAAPLSARSVASILKSYSIRENVSGHSLRVGYVTQAGLDGKDNASTRVVTGHASDAMLNEYKRVIDPQRQGPGSLL